MELPAGLALETWAAIYPRIEAVREGVMFWLGDWMLYGETAYGEESSQALPENEYSAATLRACRWVASRIPPERRRAGLSWSHHREVAALDEAEQDRLLNLCEAEGWTCRRLREEVSQAQGRVPRRVDKAAALALSNDRLGLSWRAEDHAALVAALGEEVV